MQHTDHARHALHAIFSAAAATPTAAAVAPRMYEHPVLPSSLLSHAPHHQSHHTTPASSTHLVYLDAGGGGCLQLLDGGATLADQLAHQVL